MNTLLPRLLAILLVPAVLAAAETPRSDKTPAKAPVKNDSRWVFSLLPRSMQRNPTVDVAAITEMTDLGKKLRPVSAEDPMYYVAVSAGFHAEGDGDTRERPVQVQKLEETLEHSLAANGFIKAVGDHQPTLVLFYSWGMHNKLDENAIDLGCHNLLSRAKLVGGEKFARDLAKVIDETALMDESSYGISSPIYRFVNRDTLTMSLWEQIRDDCYFFVVSAYEGAALAKGERRLLWRTKLTTAANGISLAESLPSIVLGGTDFFGKPMDATSYVQKKINRSGKVDIGEAQVKEYIEPAKTDGGAK